MGIKGLSDLISKYAPEARVILPLDAFRGTRIAVDAYIIMNSRLATATRDVVMKTDLLTGPPSEIEVRERWIRQILHFIRVLMNNGITPVFVFDGKSPVSKSLVREKRAKDKQEKREKIEKLTEKIQTDDLLVDMRDVDQLRKERCNFLDMTPSDVALVKGIVSGLGIPCLQAEGDGERLCSMLALDGLVSAVFSKDSDNLVYGTPILIQDFVDKGIVRETDDGFRQKTEAVTCFLSKPLLDKLGLNRDEFRDLCILCGCDYNVNIRGYGPVKAYALIKKHRTLDDLPATLDKGVLLVDTCRTLFTPVDHRTLIDGLIGRDVDWTTGPVDQYLNIDRTSLATCRPLLADLNADDLLLPFTSLFTFLVEPSTREIDLSEERPVDVSPKKLKGKTKKPQLVKKSDLSEEAQPPKKPRLRRLKSKVKPDPLDL